MTGAVPLFSGAQSDPKVWRVHVALPKDGGPHVPGSEEGCALLSFSGAPVSLGCDRGAHVGSSLDRTMLTYFELRPNCRFKEQVHKSEQITLVLEGELYFETAKGVYPVRKGEVIAIPSMLPHAVFSKKSFVKAVDAWSPVMDKYK